MANSTTYLDCRIKWQIVFRESVDSCLTRRMECHNTDLATSSMTTPLILSLETATRGGSVWLGYGTVDLAPRIGDPKVSQSATLLKDISDSLDEAGAKLAEVDLFACASAPGSFHGFVGGRA